jgi:excisionase family DNA binding protein
MSEPVQLTVGELRDLVAQWIKDANAADRQRKLLTPEKLALKLSVPVSWVYEQSRQGKIPTHKLGRYLRFDVAEVLEAQKKKTP